MCNSTIGFGSIKSFNCAQQGLLLSKEFIFPCLKVGVKTKAKVFPAAKSPFFKLLVYFAIEKNLPYPIITALV